MSLILIKSFISYNTLTSILTLVTLAVVVSVVVMIIRRRRTEPLRSLAVFIDSIPFLAGIMPVTGLLPGIHAISRALSPHAGGCDQCVAAAGFQELFFTLTVLGGLFFIFLEAWLIVRMMYGRFLHELDTLPN